MAITHTFVSAKADSSDPTLIQPSHWNASHTLDIFVDDEVPVLTGTDTLTLDYTPSPAASLMLFKNGQLLYSTVGYTLVSNVITLLPGYEDNSDLWRAFYRKA